MADCSAAGTALDRVARAATGGGANNGANTKQVVANLLGHGTVAAPSTASRPLAPPSSLRLPLSHQQATTSNKSSETAASRMEHAWGTAPLPPQMQQQHQVPSQHAAMFLPQQAMLSRHPAMLQQQQQQQQHMMMMQQQHMMQQMQQMNLWMSQQKQQQQSTEFVQEQDDAHVTEQEEQRDSSTQQQQQKDAAYIPQEDDVHTWHEGLEEDWAAAQGATIEELSQAWAQAEADYYDDAANLASAVQHDPEQDAFLMYPYDFASSSTTKEQVDATRDYMKEGLEYFEQGRMSLAIECFETEVQHVHPDNAKAWHMLGKCHAENDEDRKAIACLERSVERDPYNPEALLAMGVSYVNELNPARALHSLKAWITHNPKYAGLELVEDDVYGSSEAGESEFDQVQRLLLRALEFGEDEYGYVHEALGVVYNVSRDYTAAVEAFRKALKARGENDYSLWNKLGATLANSNQSQEALPAYHRALQIKPKYARAWLNMAISHSNLQNYDEAARCYLQTLSLNPAAVHCWSYLRIALSCSEQWDLIPIAAAQDLKAFREHYDFVVYDSDQR